MEGGVEVGGDGDRVDGDGVSLSVDGGMCGGREGCVEVETW